MGDVASEQALRSVDNKGRPAKRKWLVGVWVVSTALATTGWWAGLAFTAIWLMERALS